MLLTYIFLIFKSTVSDSLHLYAILKHFFLDKHCLLKQISTRVKDNKSSMRRQHVEKYWLCKYSRKNQTLNVLNIHSDVPFVLDP